MQRTLISLAVEGVFYPAGTPHYFTLVYWFENDYKGVPQKHYAPSWAGVRPVEGG